MATKEQLARIIQGKASALCSPEGERIIDSHSRSASSTAPQRTDEGRVIYTDIPKPDYNYDTGYEVESVANRKNTDLYYSNESAEFSRMPNAIKQSMLENRIDVSSLNPEGGTSFLDEIAKNTNKPQKRIAETANSATVGGVDYALIKSIVKECLSETKSEMLTENSSLKTIKLSAGNIKIVDNSGNVYVARLEKVGNITDKKK